MGGGFELALGCDMIVATRSATFRFPRMGAITRDRRADFGLQLSNLDGQRRLRHAQSFCGSADATLFCHGNEVAKPAEIHRHTETIWVGAKFVLDRELTRVSFLLSIRLRPEAASSFGSRG